MEDKYHFSSEKKYLKELFRKLRVRKSAYTEQQDLDFRCSLFAKEALNLLGFPVYITKSFADKCGRILVQVTDDARLDYQKKVLDTKH